MPSSSKPPPAGSLDPTFRNFSLEKAATYASFRQGYSNSLYELVVSHHRQHSGDASFGAVLDVGCGTGSVTRAMAAHFAAATGIDPGDAMIAQARAIGGLTVSGADIAYDTLAAENLDRLPRASADLLTAGMAAHWFDMERFWHGAAHVVKPGGTVALWTRSSLFCHPNTPNAEKVQRALSDLEDNILGPYELPSNRLSRGMYDKLPLPWTLNTPMTAFAADTFIRLEWNRDGKLDGTEDFFGGSSEMTLRELMGSLGTASMVLRWREANPELDGTERDCVSVTMRRVQEAISEASGVKGDLDSSKIRVSSATTMLLFTRGG